MKILTSDALVLPSEPLETVMSRAPNVWRVARETISVYAEETAAAASMIFLSRATARLYAA